MEELTPFEINKWLQLLPHKIGEQARVAEQGELATRVAKQKLDVARASSYLKNKAMYPSATTKEIDARVILDEAVDAATQELIAAEGAWRSDQIEYETLNNKFIGLRKIASLKEQELKSIPE